MIRIPCLLALSRCRLFTQAIVIGWRNEQKWRDIGDGEACFLEFSITFREKTLLLFSHLESTIYHFNDWKMNKFLCSVYNIIYCMVFNSLNPENITSRICLLKRMSDRLFLYIRNEFVYNTYEQEHTLKAKIGFTKSKRVCLQ